MTAAGSPFVDRLATLSADLNRIDSDDAAGSRALETVEAVYDAPVAIVWEYGPDTQPPTPLAASTTATAMLSESPWTPPEPLSAASTAPEAVGGAAGARTTADPREPLRRELLVAVDSRRVLSLGSTEPGVFDETDTARLQRIARVLAGALDRIDGTAQSVPESEPGLRPSDTSALRRLHELTVASDDFDGTIDRLLSLGRDHFDLDTGILSCIEGTDYEIEAVVDTTASHEVGDVFELGETMCAVTLAASATEPLAFADVADTDHSEHPVADSLGAYIAAPVVVGGETYGTVNFSSVDPRAERFRDGEREFVKLLAQWIGNEIERRQRVAELERYETILEAVDDPVYALDTDARFTFVNEATKREFGYGKEILGEHVSIGMTDEDIQRVVAQRRALLETDERSKTAQFELETADGDNRLVENRLAVIGETGFDGTAGVLRDVTEREQRRRQLESFQQGVEEAADGVAILEDGEYVYVDQSHLDMYGFEREEQLLGNSWRLLYDDDEVERLEAEAFPALETDGYWRGMVTGTRPNGSQFPAALSLTIVDDGRLVCTVRDETERLARKRELETRSAAMEATTDGIALLGADGTYTYVNQAHAAVYGYDSSDAFLGEHWQMCYDDAECDRFESAIMPQVKADGEWRGEATGIRQDGTTFEQELSLTATGEGIICIVRDITDRKAQQQELELKERAMDETDISIQITDPTREDNPLVYVNEGFERLTGYKREEALGRNPRFLQGPETDPERVATLREAIANDEPVTVTLRNHRADGTTYWAKLSITPVYDEDGQLTNYIGVQQDVTERRRLVETLRDRTERLELVLSETGTGISEWDLQTDAVTWDETLTETFGPGPETAEEFFDRIHPDDRASVRADATAMVESGEPWSGTFRLHTGDGSYAWLETRAVPVYEDGEPARVLSTGTDVTERKQREQALEESRQRYETLLRAAPDPVFVADAESGEIVETNAAAAALRGESREDIIGRHQSELHPSGDAEAYRAIFEDAVGEEQVLPELPDGSQLELATVDGDSIPVEINAATVRISGRPVIYGVFRDISKRVEKERELELKERAMDETNLGITISDPDRPDNPLVYVNDGFVSQTGYSRAEAVGRNCRFLHRDDRDQQSLDTLRDAVANEDPVTVDLRNYRKDGEQFWNRLAVTPVYDDAGQLVNYIGIQQDVTEEKTRARQLRTLHDTTRELLQTDDMAEAATIALETLRDELGVDIGGLYRRTEDELVQVVSLGPVPASVPERVERGQTPMWEAIETGDSVVYRDVSTIDGEIIRGDVSAGAYIPLAGHGVLVAGVYDPGKLDRSTRQLIEVLSGNLVAVLDTFERTRELSREEERFQLLADSVDEYAFITVDDDGAIETWNEGAAALFGYDAETAVGMPVAALHPSPSRDSDVSDRLLQQARITGESADEGWRVRADGSEFYADVRYAKLVTDDGEFRGYAKIVRDMTERRRQRRRTELFVEESDDVVTIIDTDGTVTYVSGSAERVLGHEPEELVDENLFDYIHPDSREELMETFFTGIDGDSQSVQTECRFRSGDGEWLNVDGRCRNMLDNDAIDGMLLYLRDVTEIKERARQFESIFNQTYQFTGLLEPDGTVIEANEATFESGGFDREDIVGSPLYEAPWWTHSDDVSDRVRDALERAADGEFVRYETEVRGASGHAVIDFSAKPVVDEDGEISMLVVEGREITDRIRRQRHLQVMQRVLRHNMRNDLTKLRGFTEALYTETNEETRTRHFETIEAILDKWAAMTEKMRQIRHVLEDYQEYSGGMAADALVEDAVAVTDETAVTTTVSDEVAGETAKQIPRGMTEAVRELVDNAVKVTDGSAASVEVTVSQSGGDWVELTVADTGPGMPDAEASVLASGEETPLNHGQGLGLWMVRMLIRQVGGTVSVDVTEQGTTVTLRVPTSDQLSRGP